MRNHFLVFFSLMLFSVASFADSNLNCKLYNSDLSAQLSTEVLETNFTRQTFLVFTDPVAWYPDVTRFQLVYSSGGRSSEALQIVAYAISAGGKPQIVFIHLDPINENIRYGKIEAGGFASDIQSTSKNRKVYDIQCFYSK